MSTTLSPTAAAGTPLTRTQTQATGVPVEARSAGAPDRVAAAQNSAAPLLTIGAVALAQFVPGVTELEGATAIANTVGIGVRAALSNPVVGVAVGVAGSELLDYAKTLAHDAWSAQPGSQALTKVASGLDSSVRMGLGIPPSGDR